MPEYLSPGVYVEEVSLGARPIGGVGTSTAGFVGMTERGPEAPRLVTSWLDYQRWYGDYIPDMSYLAYAVQGFFDNGGQRCFVTRAVSQDAVVATRVIGGMTFYAVGHGAWGNNVLVRVTEASSRADGLFKVILFCYTTFPANFIDPFAEPTNPLRSLPTYQETFDELSARPGASNNAETIINASSKLVRVAWNDLAVQARLPDTDLSAGQLENGADGSAIGVDDYVGNLNSIPGGPLNRPDITDLLGRGRGLEALRTVDEIALLLAPDEVRSELGQLSNMVILQCEQLADRFGVISVRQGQSDVGTLNPIADTSYAALYYPWIEIFDPSINKMRLVPPSGHVAGIIARTDISRGVHKAPANEIVRDAVNIEFPVTKGMQDILNPRGINCVRDFRADRRGIRLWGARTMSSDPLWKYVNVRRLFIYLEESIDEGTQWVVFEPNDELTWGYVRRSITNFLIRVWKSGALMGVTQEEAFFVRCDRTTMTEDDIDNGRLICYIGVCPVKPAEFVIFRISQKTLTEGQ